MPTSKPNHAALLAFLTHEAASARKEQDSFVEAASKSVETAIQWRADGALVAVFTERHAKTVLEQVKLGSDLVLIYENLIDRLTMLACGRDNEQAEVRAIAKLVRELKGWLS